MMIDTAGMPVTYPVPVDRGAVLPEDPVGVLWLNAAFVTFYFKATHSRLRNGFQPSHCYEDPRYRRVTGHMGGYRFRDEAFGCPDDEYPYLDLPEEPTQLSYPRSKMRPNFAWESVAVETMLPAGAGFQRCVLIFNLNADGSWCRNRAVTIVPRRAFSRPSCGRRHGLIDLVHPDAANLLSRSGTVPSHDQSSFSVVPRLDLRFRHFDGSRFDLIPIREFGEDWNPRACHVRYYCTEPTRLNGSIRIGPARMPKLGFSPKEFWHRYCGGGFHRVHEATAFAVVGEDRVLRKGARYQLRTSRVSWRRNRTI